MQTDCFGWMPVCYMKYEKQGENRNGILPVFIQTEQYAAPFLLPIR